MNLENGELHIWRYTLDNTEYEAEKSSPLLSTKEQKRCDDYLSEAEKMRYTCNHRFVRQVLAKYLNMAPSQIEFSYAEMGKPFVKNSDIFFSYSYRTTFGLLAIYKNEEVGIDIEKMKVLQDVPTFAAFSFSEKEKKILFKSDNEKVQDTLFTFWTFKEAIIKALGVGLNADLTQIDLSEFFYKELNPLPYDKNSVYTIKQIRANEGYKAAIAVKGKLNGCIEFEHKKN